MRTRTPPPCCREVSKWLRHHCGPYALAPLTGTDARALHAFVHLVELYSVSRDRVAIDSMRLLLLAAQPKVWHLFKRSIPMVMDWSDEEQIWKLIVGDPVDRDLASAALRAGATGALQ